ncbi:hypothetical protein [Psychrosphaera aestuarii]|uniref:hypothetical protein n=1 Tax=Psychrosphaera aestuarii TaxID=1266052 RepID=UPI001B31D6EB|nr:hypothetical protein [Psychrosphaera aestuarii]
MAAFKWTIERDHYLKEQWPEKRAVDIADDLDVSKHVIMRRVRKLDLPKKPPQRVLKHHYHWSTSMDEFLKDNYQKQSNQELSTHLNVSIQAVMRRKKKLDLLRNKTLRTHFKWEKDDISRLITLFNARQPISDIAKTIEISEPAVKRKLKSLGLSRQAQRIEMM